MTQTHRKVVVVTLRAGIDPTPGMLSEAVAGSDAEYVALLRDGDEWTDPEKLATQVEFLDARPDCALCFHDCTIDCGDPSLSPRKLVHGERPGERVATNELLGASFVQTSTLLFRRSLVAELRDWTAPLSANVIALLASRAAPVGYVDRPMSTHRQPRSDRSAASRARRWAASVETYERLAGALGPEHRADVERIVRDRSYAAAVCYERAYDFGNALKYVTRALEIPGDLRDALVAKANRRLRSFGLAIVTRASFAFEWLVRELHWLTVNSWVQLRSHRRLERRAPVGFIVASPNPAPESESRPGLTWIDLEWASAAAEAVEVHLGRPDGPLVGKTGPFGSAQTGEWVSDGTIFYLQNSIGDDGDLPLTRRYTLDVVRIRVR